MVSYSDKFKVGEEVKMFDKDDPEDPFWAYGVVLEVGDESILIQWEDLRDPTDHDLSEFELIKHK